MRKQYIKSTSIERLIRLLFPEGKIGKGPVELRHIADTLHKILEPLGLQISLEHLFKGFLELSYTIAVIEPLSENIKLKPYLDTNSNLIYIGIDSQSIVRLKTLSKVLAEGKILQSHNSRLFYDQLINFFINEKLISSGRSSYRSI
jgi:hypothetical protein